MTTETADVTIHVEEDRDGFGWVFAQIQSEYVDLDAPEGSSHGSAVEWVETEILNALDGDGDLDERLVDERRRGRFEAAPTVATVTIDTDARRVLDADVVESLDEAAEPEEVDA